MLEFYRMTDKLETSKERAVRRIVVIGAGAVGSALGAFLHRTGQRVVLICRPAHVAAIRHNGLQVDGDMGDFIAPIEAAETLDFRPDLALLTVKTQDVVAAVKANQAFLNDVPVVTFQNGVHISTIARGSGTNGCTTAHRCGRPGPRKSST